MTRARELANLAGVSETALSNRNLIINGAMQISQRGTDIDDISGDTAYNMDRFRTRDYGGNGTYDYDQSGNVPNSTFNKSLKLTCKSAATDIGTFGYSLEQIIEGYNIAQLHLGRSTAKPITVSFWVKSSIAGTYSTGLRTTVGEFSFTTEFTLSANTWTYVTYTAPALTTTLSSLIEDNGVGLHVDIVGLGAQTSKIASTLDAWEAGNKVFSSNQTAWMSNAGATLNVTGVQLEVGEQATPFEHRSYGEELLACMRYYQQIGGENANVLCTGQCTSSTLAQFFIPFIVPVRDNPTCSVSDQTHFRVFNAAVSGIPDTTNMTIGANVAASCNGFRILATVGSGLSAGNATMLYSGDSDNNAGIIKMDAEL